MKYLLFLFVFFPAAARAQLTVASAKEIVNTYRVGYSNYFAPFLEHPGYGAPWILTRDGGAAIYGDNMLYKLDRTGKEEWMQRVIPEFNALESQGVVEDASGNLYVFMLSYDNRRYRGGSERVLCYDRKGEVLWDRTLGAYTLKNNPTVSYIRALDDGRIYLRGHVVTEDPEQGKDPRYHFWEGWLDSTGKLEQQSGDVIDWAKGEWQKWYAPE